MNNKTFHRVEFATRKGGKKHWYIDVMASSVDEARSTAVEMWSKKYKLFDKVPHMFRIAVRKLENDETPSTYNWFIQIF